MPVTTNTEVVTGQPANTTPITHVLPGGDLTGKLCMLFGYADKTGSAPNLDVTGMTGLTHAIDSFEFEAGSQDIVTDLWWKVLTDTETDPTMTIPFAQEHSFGMIITNGNDTTTPLDIAIAVPSTVLDESQPVHPPFTPVTDGAAGYLACVHNATSGVTAHGPPATYDLTGVDLLASRQSMVVARNLDLGTAGLQTPGAWTHTATDEVTDSVLYTIVVRPAVVAPPVVDDVQRGQSGLLVEEISTFQFIEGAAQQVGTGLELVWDFDGDGDYDEPEENVTSDLLGLQTSIGRDFPSEFNGKITPGSIRATMRNEDARYTAFNSNSPLVVPPFSLATGNKVRLRTVNAPESEPIVLASDRFDGVGELGQDDTGKPWSNIVAGAPPAYRDGDGFAVLDDTKNGIGSTPVVDVGVADYYAQATWDHFDDTNRYGIAYRVASEGNLGLVEFSSGRIRHITITADVETEHTNLFIEQIRNTTIGVLVSGSDVTIYLDGVLAFTDTGLAFGTSETLVGLSGTHNTQRPVKCEEFFVWDGLRQPDLESLWTGRVSSIKPKISNDGSRIATVDAIGLFAGLSKVDVKPRPSVGVIGGLTFAGFSPGTYPGYLIGDTLRKSDLLLPPCDQGIDRGEEILGSVAFGEARPITITRKIEEAELGLLWEEESGCFRFAGSASVGGQGVGPVSVWGDSDSAQFRFEDIEPIDWSREVINRAEPSVSTLTPIATNSGTSTNATAPGVAAPVQLIYPATFVNVGDLAVFIVMSTVYTPGEQWLIPSGVVSLRDVGDTPYAVRGFAKVLTASDIKPGSIDTVYADDGVAGGSWMAKRFIFTDWYGEIASGVKLNVNGLGPPNGLDEARAGVNDPPALTWLDIPSVFIAGRMGAVASTAPGVVATSQSNDAAPDGYINESSSFFPGNTDDHDLGLQNAFKHDVSSVENPGPFTSEFRNFDYIEAFTLAVRGFQGDPPGSGRTTIYNNLASQTARSSVLSYPNPARILRNQGRSDDYGNAILGRHSTDKPLLRVSFSANKSAGYRSQALSIRVQDKIRVILDGRSGMTYTGDFIVENVRHILSKGATSWTVIWELRPL